MYYDNWHLIAGKRSDANNVIIVSIDNDAYLNPDFKDDPLVFWGPHFAKAIERLRFYGAKSIGIDFLFLITPENWIKKIENLAPNSNINISSTYDLPLLEQISFGDVALAALLAKKRNNEIERILPPFEYWSVLPRFPQGIGLANIKQDDDGVVRSFYPVFDLTEEPRTSFGAMLVSILKNGEDSGNLINESIKPYEVTDAVPIGFLGPPDGKTIPRIPFNVLFKPDNLIDPYIKNLIKNKIVIISEEHMGSQDVYQSPYSRRFIGKRKWEMMPGAEIHADIIETLLTGRFPHPVSKEVKICFEASAILISIFIFLNISFFYGAVYFFSAFVLTLIISYFLFMNNINLPVFGAQSGILASFIISAGIRFTKSERQKQHIRSVFKRYVSDEVIEELVSNEKLPELGGELTEITVIFSDIRNFTKISETVQAHELVEVLNIYFSRVCEPILENGGTIDKFIGDAVMAIFGAPVKYHDHAERAIKAAICMKKVADDFRIWIKERFKAYDLPEFDIGIGIHTGKAIVGNIGSSMRLDYTAIGDTVNIASRIEGETKNLGWPVVATAETVSASGIVIKEYESRTIHVKGKERPVEVVRIPPF